MSNGVIEMPDGKKKCVIVRVRAGGKTMTTKVCGEDLEVREVNE